MNNIHYSITPVTTKEFPELVRIWEASVRATHSFLKEEDLLFYKERIPGMYFPNLDLYGLRDENDSLKGFMGISGNKLEMLFLHPDSKGKGWGKVLLQHAVSALQVTEVDVNEQNEHATGFYQHAGFRVTGRSERDGEGKAYPVLHMKL